MLPLVLQVLWERTRQERACGWSRTELVRHQRKQTDQLRRFVMERSPFYQRFHRGFEARPLEELPILTKAELMENFDTVVTNPSLRLPELEFHVKQNTQDLFQGRYTVLATSGSTGRRGIFVFDRPEWIRALANISRPMAWAGVKPRLTRPPKSAMIASKTRSHYSAQVSKDLSSRMLPSLRLDAGEPLPELVRQLNDWQPEILAGYPSVLRQLTGEQRAGRLRIRPQTVAISAEVLTQETRSAVKQAWGVSVFDTYGATEYAPISAECQAGNKHLFEDGAVIEVVDERGRRVPQGEAGERILITVFERHTQPLIRYEISDMVRTLEGDCPCGRPFRMIQSIEGRIEDILDFSLPDGRTISIHPNLFHQVLETQPVTGWQVLQEDLGLRIGLTGVRDTSLPARVELEVRQMLEAQGLRGESVAVEAVDTLRRGATGKAPLITSLLQRRIQTRTPTRGKAIERTA